MQLNKAITSVLKGSIAKLAKTVKLSPEKSAWQTVAPAYKAYAEGKNDEALKHLDKLFLELNHAQGQLYLAAAYLLFSDSRLEKGKASLNHAKNFDKNIISEELYRSVKLEYAVLEGENHNDLKRQLRDLLKTKDAFVNFHVARAFVNLGAKRTASSALEELELSSLPLAYKQLQKRLLADLYMARGKESEAIALYQALLADLKDKDKNAVLLILAEAQLRMAQPEHAFETLKQLQVPEDDIGFVRLKYLQGVALRHSGQFEDAFVCMHAAYNSILKHGGLPFEIVLELARLFADLGQIDKSVDTYQQAFSVVSSEQYTMLMHEYGNLLKAEEQYAKAKDALETVVKDVRYPKRAEACAELAMVLYKLGNFDHAKALASYAKDHQVKGLPSLCLGNVALEYYHFVEAERHFEQAAADVSEGSSLWLSAQLMLAQTFSRESHATPERLIFHSEQALKYLSPHDEWVPTLKGYISIARESLQDNAKLN